MSSASACADPGICTKWGGGEGVEGHLTVKSSDSIVLLFLLFLVFTFNLFNSFTEGTDPRVQGGGGRPNANFCRNLSKL